MQLIVNKAVKFHYEIIETVSAGLQLQGWEVKSLRDKKAQLRGAWVKIDDRLEAWLQGMMVSPWKGQGDEQSSRRGRKLLLQKSEIIRLQHKCQEKSLTIVPLAIVARKHYLKCDIALAKGRKKYEKKRHLIAAEQKRQAARAIKTFSQR